MSNFRQQLIDMITERRERLPFHKTIELQGCQPEDIEKVMKAQNVDYLPSIYRDFLLVVGAKSGGWFLGSDITINRLLNMKEAFKEELEYANMWDEKYDGAFVFMDHQGYVDYFFHTANREEDPLVFVFTEDKIIAYDCRLSEYLLHKKRF